MKIKYKLTRAFMLSLITSASLVTTANAVVTFTFSQVGNDVLATVSGSFNLAGSTRLGDDFLDNASLFGNTNAFGVIQAGTTDDYLAVVTASGLLVGPDSTNSTITLGYENAGIGDDPLANDSIFVAGTTPLNGLVSVPTSIFRWDDTTISAIGLGGLSSTSPLTVATVSGSGDSIQFISTVPEPSSALLLGFGAVGFTLRRQRRKN